MTLRIYSPYFPYPPFEGAYHVIYNQAAYLADRFDVELVVWRNSLATVEEKIRSAKYFPYKGSIKTVSLTEKDWKETQLMRLTRVLRSLNSRDPSPALYYYSSEVNPYLQDKSFEQRDLGIYHYSFAGLWQEGHRRSFEKKRVCMMHNLEADLFDIRGMASKNPVAKWLHAKNSEKLKALEGRLLEYFDELWFLSEVDRIDYEHRYSVKKPEKLRVVAPTFSRELFDTIRGNRRADLSRKGVRLGLLGAMNFAPHEMGVQWLINEVFPLLKKENFQGEILLGGKYASHGLIEQIKDYPFCRHLGFVSDLIRYYCEVDGILVPHLAGSGVRMKMLEALSAGLPVICHPGAIAPLHKELHTAPFILSATKASEWAEAILDHARWAEMQRSLTDVPAQLTGDFAYDFLMDGIDGLKR